MPELTFNLLTALKDKGWKIATAESCTGGLIAAALTDIPGASCVFDRGFVTYSNDAKREMLGVPAGILQKHGAVSGETARAMVEGALKHSLADLAVSVTGIAGPDGGTKEKPVGLVYIGFGRRDETPQVEKYMFKGDRASVRTQTVRAALKHALHLLET
ncbi:MAG: CinA family protein [Rhodospirillales bacterium]|nr:CinA family protein [Alphaproteobacteria bacterium]USO03340.1 MAG: CinA family protein [Rhodospirillales bacterium]